MITRDEITGIVLCGGKGSRLDGQDKPLIKLGGRRMIDHVCERLTPQVASFIISCSRNVAIYESLNCQLCVDRDNDRGPLAGLTEAFALVNTEWVITTPGDTPFLCRELVMRLSTAAELQGVAVPRVGEYRQNLCLLINRERRQALLEFYQDGGSAVKDWLDANHIEPTDLTDLEHNFFNVNTSAELAEAVQRIDKMERSGTD